MTPVKPAVAVLIAVGIVVAWMTWPQPILSHVTTTNTVLFDREIVRILDRHCVACHAQDSLASGLETYEATWLSREPVLAAVLSHRMPPWAAVPGYGKFANDNSLTLREMQFVVSWVEGLGPRNSGAVFLNVRDAGVVPEVIEAHAEFDQWMLGEPDLVVRLDATVVEPGQGERIERSVVDLGFGGERWVRGIEYLPGDRRVVRAAKFTIEGTGQWLGSWTPWHGYVELPEGVAILLSDDARVVAEVYYGTTDERVVDEGSLGLYFLSEGVPPVAPASDLVLSVQGGLLAGARDQRFSVEGGVLESDTAILSLLPEFEQGIQSFEVSARTPDGGTKILLFAKDIPVEWPTPYILADPVMLPAGSRLRVVAHFDNTSDASQVAGIRVTVSRY